MKTITPGFIPQPAAWWVGQIIKCPLCNGVFQLEVDDPVVCMPDQLSDGIGHVACPTPKCNRVHWVYP